jgi:hypothetical protein
LGVALVGMPWGSIDVLVSESGGGDTPAPALGIMPVAEWQRGAFVIGMAPRLILNVRDDEDPSASAGTIWTVLLRIGASTQSDGRLDFYGYVTPGVSWLVRPAYETSSGIALGAHVGLRGKMANRMFWTAEVGGERLYHALAYTYLQVGLAIGWRFEMPPRARPMP